MFNMVSKVLVKNEYECSNFDEAYDLMTMLI